MNPGKLNKKIEIQTCTKTKDSEGVEILTWTTLRSIFASVEDVIVKTTNEDNAIVTQVETNMIVRKNYESLITSKIRIVYKNRNYVVLDISEVDDNYIKIITKGEKLYEC